MPPKRKKPFDRETDKARNFEFMLYPVTTSYNYEEVLELLKGRFTKWAYIIHDRDTDENGELIGAHTHFYGAGPSPVLIKTVANYSGVPWNDIRPIMDWKAAIQYSIHVNDPDKFLYDPSDVKSNFDHRAFFNTNRSDEEDAELIFDYICETNCMTKKQLVRWVFDNHCWAAYRRAASTWSDLLYENRLRMYAKYNVDQDLNTAAVNAANRVIFSECNDNDPVPFEQMSL